MFKSEIIGNLGADAEIKDNNGRKSISFRMAHSEKYRDSNGQLTECTIWISVFKPAHDNDNLCQYLTKGTRVSCAETSPLIVIKVKTAGRLA